MAKYTIKLTQKFNIQVDEENLSTTIKRAKEKIAWYRLVILVPTIMLVTQKAGKMKSMANLICN